MTDTKKGLHPGAVWRKADLQCHSPRDRTWKGPEELPGGNSAGEAAREAWADSFIAACKAKDINVIAITDHHDVVMGTYVKRAAERVASDILTYYGVEITCSDDAQCLAIIDPSVAPEVLNKFAALPGVTPSSATEAKCCETTPANLTVAELFEHVAADGPMRDYSVLLPHFSDDTAHKHLNKPRHHARFANLPCDGVYIEKQASALLPDTVEKIQGKNEQWGTRRRALIATGDNRFPDWGRLGQHKCWIKLGEPTIEALRQAMLADEARVSHVQPQIPSETIVELRVKSTLTGPEELRVSLNPGFTCESASDFDTV